MNRLGDIHPILFAAYPILFLFSKNLGLVSLGQIVLPIGISVGAVLLLWLGLSFVLKDKTKAGIMASALLVLFFSYGHLFNLAGNKVIGGIDLGQHKYVFPAWGSLGILLCVVLWRTRRNLRRVADVLNFMSAALVVITVATALLGLIGGGGIGERAEAGPVGSQEPERQPDIYYVILDGCARADVLKEVYGLDISELLERFTEQGFFVASRSRTNYSQTYLSLASSLNLTYLDELASQVGADSDNRLPLRLMIHDSEVVRFLRERGYLFVSFATGMDYTQIKSADRYLSPSGSLSEFHNVLLNTTPIPGLINRLLGGSSDFQYDSHRRRILYTLEHLQDMARMEAPTFTFAHILACHPPFVFGENGEEINPDRNYELLDGDFFMNVAGRDEYVAGYRQQFAYILGRLEEAAEEIIASSPEPPIIIVQADHGGGSMLNFEELGQTNLQERIPIFNAYYLPDGGQQGLYDEITPVNTFRVILDTYFGADLGLLEDRSYYSPLSRPYQLTDVTDAVDGNEGR